MWISVTLEAAMPIDDIKNFVLVSPTLATAGQPSEHQLREVAAAGYTVDINLGLLDPRYCLPDEAGLAQSLGLEYHHIPVNFQAPTLEDLKRFFAVMEAVGEKKVFVHCAANMRVTGFVSLYGQAKLGWSREQAEALLARVWTPNEVWADFLDKARQAINAGMW